VNRHDFVNKVPNAPDKANKNLLRLKMAWGDYLYLEVAEAKANEGSAVVQDFENKLKKIIDSMDDFALIESGDHDEVEYTFFFDKSFDTVTFWVFPTPDEDGEKSYKLTMNIIDILTWKPKKIKDMIREKANEQERLSNQEDQEPF
jgi:hypothetical protein